MLNTIKPERLIVAAAGAGRAGDLALAFFRGMWVDDRNIADEAVMRADGRRAGLDATRCWPRSRRRR